MGYTSLFSSVDEILEDRIEDPEEILTNLGFANQGDMESPIFKVPVRFLQAPTQASGIHVKKFFENNPDLREYFAAKGVVLDEKCKPGNVCHDSLLQLAHVDKYTNLSQLAAYCMSSDVPNRFLLSLVKMFPTLPLFSASVEMGSEFGADSNIELPLAGQMGNIGMSNINVSDCCAAEQIHEAVVAMSIGSMTCSVKTATCGLRGCENADLKNVHILAACQAEASIMEMCTRPSHQNCTSYPPRCGEDSSHITSPGFDSLLDHVTNSSKDTAPRFVTIASDSLPGSDDQLCRCDYTEEQWDYSDVVGFQSENRPKKSFSMPKLELYHSDEFYSNNNEFPRSETIDFFIYDYDNAKSESLLDDEMAAFDPKYNNNIKGLETLL